MSRTIKRGAPARRPAAKRKPVKKASLAARLGLGPAPGSNFQYSGWTTECNHLGNVAYRTGRKLEWDHAALRATNAPEAAPFIRRPAYRAGWQGILPG